MAHSTHTCLVEVYVVYMIVNSIISINDILDDHIVVVCTNTAYCI